MPKDKNRYIWIIILMPVLLIIWELFRLHTAGPFFLTRIDPEYPYLLNGLNCAILDFSRIGHVDHPGTPFQMLTGIFIWITYLFTGQGNLVNDVIARPELYLTDSSVLLSLMSVGSILWLGYSAHKYAGEIWAAIFLQSVFFVNYLMLDIPMRYIPDRFLPIIIIVLIGLTIKYVYQENYKGWKYALFSGLILGIGFITKFHMLSVLMLPFIVIPGIRDRLIYIIALIASSIINFLPVHSHYAYFREFIKRIATHDGLYGSGSEIMFNWNNFTNSINDIIRDNFSFVFVFTLSLTVIVFLLIKPVFRKTYIREFRLLLAFVLVSVVGILFIAKHYKNYYVIPVISLVTLAYYIVYRIINGLTKFRYTGLIMCVVLAGLIYKSVSIMYPFYKVKKDFRNRDMLMALYIKNNVSCNDYILVEPTWMSGPNIENGMTYGITYVAKSYLYYNAFEKNYPNLLTWEGKNRPLKYFRMIEADMELILKSGKRIFVYSSDGRDAGTICNYIQHIADSLCLTVSSDTVFANSQKHEYLIRSVVNDNWKITEDRNYGFEKEIRGVVYSDDEIDSIQGMCILDGSEVYNGRYSLVLNEKERNSPRFEINNINEKDIIEIQFKFKLENDIDLENIEIKCLNQNDSLLFVTDRYIATIDRGWKYYRIKKKINVPVINNKIWCYIKYNGNGTMYSDDLTMNHFSKR